MRNGKRNRRLTSAVKSHSPRARIVVFLDPDLLDRLLREDVSGAEEYNGRNDLGEEGTGGELGLVPNTQLVNPSVNWEGVVKLTSESALLFTVSASPGACAFAKVSGAGRTRL